jgi:hypothetical protein
MNAAPEMQTRYAADATRQPAPATRRTGNESVLTYESRATFGDARHFGRVVAANATTADRPAVYLPVDIQTPTQVVQHRNSTAPAEYLQLAPVAAPTADGDSAHRARRVPPRTSRIGHHVDGALVVALLAPPALIGLLMALGLQFALAVCVMFAVVFAVTTSEDAMWTWRRHTDRESDGYPGR